jgi:hypothetical protein
MKGSVLEPAAGSNLLRIPQDFSLLAGGPLFRLLCRLHLSDDALRMARRRMIVITLLA